MNRLLVFSIFLIVLINFTHAFVQKARCHLQKNNIDLGTIFIEEETFNEIPYLKFTGQLILNRFANGNFGFHIHENPESDNCINAGSHYNPHKMVHGAPNNRVRHLGDLGNIGVNNKKANVNIRIENISLNGKYSVLNRSIVLHSAIDDLGEGGNQESLKTGNAGSRFACCVITPIKK